MNIGNMAKGMNDVERHGLVIGDDIEPIPNGDDAQHTDYAAIQQQLAAAREELGEARALIQMQTRAIKNQREALQVAEAESARYRAMRHARHAGWGKGASRDLWFDILRAETPDQLDAAIDATLQRDRQP